MKKIILLVISLFLVLLLFSCQNQSNDNPETTGPETEKTPITETTAPETTEKTPPSTTAPETSSNNSADSQETDKNTDTENKNETPPTQITTVPNGLRDIEEPFLSVFTNQQPIDFDNLSINIMIINTNDEIYHEEILPIGCVEGGNERRIATSFILPNNCELYLYSTLLGDGSVITITTQILASSE